MNTLPEQQLIIDIRFLIDQAKTQVARTVNQQMTLLYWSIGKRIREEVLKEERAEYGQNVIISLGKYLSAEYGSGFERSNLLRMVQFYDFFEEAEIVATMSRQLTWSHIKLLLPVKDKNARNFYALMTGHNYWSVRQLGSQIHSLLYERTLVSRKEKHEIEAILPLDMGNSSLTPDLILKDPYCLEFLKLPNPYQESDLEEAILVEIQKFILELGTGFSFVERQKRMTVDENHYWLDLLFFNRKLKRLVAVELKKTEFKPEYKGQMELYLGWLKKYEMMEGEKPPIGIILCTEKSPHQIELLDLDHSGIHVAEYWTELPPLDVFELKVREIVTLAKERLEAAKQTKELEINE